MKKNLAKKVTLSILAGAVLMSSSVAFAVKAPEASEYWIDIEDGEFLRNADTNLDGNKISSVNGTEEDYFYGSRPIDEDGKASGGKVTLDEDVAVGAVIGGIGDTAIGNTVTISNGLVKYEAIGGNGYGVTENSVVINDGTIGSDDDFAMVAGGIGVKVENNDVFINDGEVNGNVFGGSGQYNDGEVKGNTVNIAGGSIYGAVLGGAANPISSVVEGNEVKITGGEIYGNVLGGTGDSVTGNIVTVSNEKEDCYINDIVFGGQGNTVVGNTVNVTGGYLLDIVGGDGFEAKNNVVNISGGVLGFKGINENNAYYCMIVGGGGNNVEGNIVNITGGDITGEIIGGVGFSNNQGGNPKAANPNRPAQGAISVVNNTVNIADSPNLNFAYLIGADVTQVEELKVDGNTLNVGYDEGVDDGGGKDSPTGYKTWTNAPSPEVSGQQQVKAAVQKPSPTPITGVVRGIAGFQTINFNNLKWEPEGTVLGVRGDADLDGTKIGKVSIIEGNVKNGEWMNLIEASWINGIIENLPSEKAIVDNDDNGGLSAEIDVKVYQGVAKVETLNGVLEQISEIDREMDAIRLTIKDEKADGEGIEASAPPIEKEDDDTGDDNTGDDNTGGDNTGGDNTGGDNTGGDNTGGDNTGDNNTGDDKPNTSLNPQVLVIGESRTAATAFVNQGSELVETGINALVRDNDKDVKAFAAVYGNNSEYETGSHVNVNGWSGIVGVGKTDAKGLTVGAFFENGDGNYSTHNVTDFGYLRGDGEAVYNGGGFLVRKDNANGVYTEASLRAGNLKNELRDALVGSTGAVGYDIDTFYYGAHIGVGKIIQRGADGDSIDVYGKFIYTHHDSEDFKIDGDNFHFDSVDSERLRLGFRINEVQTNKLAMYYGAAWEYEFGGDANNTVVGYDLSTPSLEGSTVIGEIGAHYKVTEKWSIDLNGRAYTGQREGFSGSVQANYSF